MGMGRRKLMKFDRARATETVETIAKIEGKDNGVGVELARLIAAKLHQSGWDVESREVLGSASAAAVRRWLDYLTYGLTVAAALSIALGGFSTFWGLLVCGLALAGWLRLLANWPRRPWLLRPLRSARLLIARKHSSNQGSPRVVIRVSLGPASHPPEATSHPFRRLVSNRLDSGQRDGAGIALVLELARGWAGHPPARVETVLAFVGGQSLDQAGDRALADLLANESLGKPTLVLTLDAPGIGKELLIHDDGRLVLDAALSLWVPHRVPTFRESRRVPRLPSRVAESEVWLGGMARHEGPQVVDLEALARAAQLVEEVVLRWGKRHSGSTETDQPADERTASRSFQKPG
jgi:hypothetical protein